MTSRAGGTRNEPGGLLLSTSAAAPRMPAHLNDVSSPQGNRARGWRQLANWPLLGDGGSAPSTVYTNVNRVSSCRIEGAEMIGCESVDFGRGLPHSELVRDASQQQRTAMDARGASTTAAVHSSGRSCTSPCCPRVAHRQRGARAGPRCLRPPAVARRLVDPLLLPLPVLSGHRHAAPGGLSAGAARLLPVVPEGHHADLTRVSSHTAGSAVSRSSASSAQNQVSLKAICSAATGSVDSNQQFAGAAKQMRARGVCLVRNTPDKRAPTAPCISPPVLPAQGHAPPQLARTLLCSRRSKEVSPPRVQLLLQPPSRVLHPERRAQSSSYTFGREVDWVHRTVVPPSCSDGAGSHRIVCHQRRA